MNEREKEQKKSKINLTSQFHLSLNKNMSVAKEFCVCCYRSEKTCYDLYINLAF